MALDIEQQLEAGITSGNCSTPCPFWNNCRPYVDPTPLEMEVITGHSVGATIDVTFVPTLHGSSTFHNETNVPGTTATVTSLGPQGAAL